jgi:hypothetical protein
MLTITPATLLTKSGASQRFFGPASVAQWIEHQGVQVPPEVLFFSVRAFCTQKAPEVRLELTTYRLTAGRATDCAIQELSGRL